MKLLTHWRYVARRAWSMRLMLLAGILTGCEAILPLYADALPRGLFAAITVVVILGAMLARITVQKGMDDE